VADVAPVHAQIRWKRRGRVRSCRFRIRHGSIPPAENSHPHVQNGPEHGLRAPRPKANGRRGLAAKVAGLSSAVIKLQDVRLRFAQPCALDWHQPGCGPARCLSGLVGPDGSGIKIQPVWRWWPEPAGCSRASARPSRRPWPTLRRPSPAMPAHRYIAPGPGEHLSPTLHVSTRTSIFPRACRLGRASCRSRSAALLERTGSGPSGCPLRRASFLGGMKQKLGLCCALIHARDR